MFCPCLGVLSSVSILETVGTLGEGVVYLLQYGLNCAFHIDSYNDDSINVTEASGLRLELVQKAVEYFVFDDVLSRVFCNFLCGTGLLNKRDCLPFVVGVRLLK